MSFKFACACCAGMITIQLILLGIINSILNNIDTNNMQCFQNRTKFLNACNDVDLGHDYIYTRPSITGGLNIYATILLILTLCASCTVCAYYRGKHQQQQTRINNPDQLLSITSIHDEL